MSEWHLGVMRLFCFDLDPIEPMVCITYIARTALALKIKLYTAWEILGICVRFSQSSLFFMIKIIYLISHSRKCILSNRFQLFLKICFKRHNYHNSSILIHLIIFQIRRQGSKIYSRSRVQFCLDDHWDGLFFYIDWDNGWSPHRSCRKA